MQKRSSTPRVICAEVASVLLLAVFACVVLQCQSRSGSIHDPDDSSGEQSMSDREREVFRRLAAGDSLSATSKAMSIDTETVRTLWKRAREKLGLESFPRRLMRRGRKD